MARILICGDFAPNNKNEDIISRQSVNKIIGDDLVKIFNKHDIIGINLETSLVNCLSPKRKRGQINHTIPEIGDFLRKARVSLCFLANNHIIDNGNDGLINTLRTLDYYGIKYVGAGKTMNDALRPFDYIDKYGKITRILNISNEEFNTFKNGQYGVNTLDLIESFDYIRQQSVNVDFLIVVFHAGVEYYELPTPYLQRICRKMIDSGACLVTCQHSHCVGTYEYYNDGLIFYGQGNFLFDDSEHPLEKSAILLSVDTETHTANFIPVTKEGSLVRLAKHEISDRILGDIEYRHSLVSDSNEIESAFKKFVDSKEREVFNACMGYNIVFRLLNKFTNGKLGNYVFNSKARMRLYNMLKSISLLEVMEEVMSRYE